MCVCVIFILITHIWIIHCCSTSHDDYIVFPNNGALDTRFSLTMMLWFKKEGNTQGPLLQYRYNEVNGVRLWDLGTSDPNFFVSINLFACL